jgi:energy-coupling factor transport system ATP-binding protein
MRPEVLILDEPTSQLDPVAAEEFFHLVERLNQEMGYTVVLIEQRLERCIHLADRLVLMEEGKVLKCGRPEEVARWQVQHRFSLLPPVARLFASLGAPTVPLTVKEGRKELRRLLEAGSAPATSGPQDYSSSVRHRERQPQAGGSPPGPRPRRQVRRPKDEPQVPVLAELKGVWFTYPNGREALKDVNLKVRAGELVAIMGENAAGKTTLLKVAAGLLKPARGRVWLGGKEAGTVSRPGLAGGVGYLSQDPNQYLFRDTVEEELRFTLASLDLEDGGAVQHTLERLGLAKYRQANPRDLSSGERQRVALASVVVARPRLLLLDEPTRGLDGRLKEELGAFLAGLAGEGAGVVVVTHDVEFAAQYADRVVIMSDGKVVADGPKREVLGSSLFCCPQMARVFRGLGDAVLTVEEALEKLTREGVFKPWLTAKAGS